MASQVEDKPAERGIQVNNILSALILAAILWVGNTILSLKDEISAIAARQMVNVTTIQKLSDTVVDHEDRLRGLERGK